MIEKDRRIERRIFAQDATDRLKPKEWLNGSGKARPGETEHQREAAQERRRQRESRTKSAPYRELIIGSLM